MDLNGNVDVTKIVEVLEKNQIARIEENLKRYEKTIHEYNDNIVKIREEASILHKQIAHINILLDALHEAVDYGIERLPEERRKYYTNIK